jgi:hypothetical protein
MRAVSTYEVYPVPRLVCSPLERAIRSLTWAALALLTMVGCAEPIRPSRCTAELGGRCWTYLGPAGTLVTSVTDVAGTYFAGTMDGFLKYDAARAQWTPSGLAGKAIYSITAVPSGDIWVTVIPHGADTTSAVAYVSADAGATWQARDGGLSAQASYHGLAISFAYDVGDPNRLYMGLSGSVVRSLDGGVTWSYAYGGPMELGLGVWAVVPSATGSSRVWAGGQDGASSAFALRSDDGGGSWTRLNPTPLFDGDAVMAMVGDPRNDGRVFLGMGAAVRVTEDAGASWRVALTTARLGWVTGLAYQGPSLVAVSDELLSPTGSPQSICGVYTSPDGGVSWDTLSVPTTAAGARGLHATAGGALLVATASGVWTLESR